MMRALHLIHSMGGGGAERELAHLAGPLRRRGVDLHVGLVQLGPNSDRLMAGGAAIHRFRINSNYDPRLVLQIERLARRMRPDVIQTWLAQMDVAGGFVARMRGVPWILAERASAAFYQRTSKNRLRVRLARGAALVQANSVEGTKYWQHVLPGIRTKFIPSPVAVAEIEAVAPADLTSAGKRDGVPLILFAGRFHEQKNVRTMLAAIAEVRRTRDIAAALCGDGPQGEDVRKWIDELGLAGHVTLPGYVKDIWAWMKAADLFVSVSHYEGRPNAVVEAAAARCPLVVSDIPEHREFLQPGVHALLADRHSPASIAAAIHGVLADRDAAARRAAAAYEVVREWTVDDIAAVHAEMYDDVVRYHARRQKRTRTA